MVIEQVRDTSLIQPEDECYNTKPCKTERFFLFGPEIGDGLAWSRISLWLVLYYS